MSERSIPVPLPDAMTQAPEVLTSEQAAELLQVSVDTLYGMSVPYVPIGKGRKSPRRRYLRATVLKWAKHRELVEALKKFHANGKLAPRGLQTSGTAAAAALPRRAAAHPAGPPPSPPANGDFRPSSSQQRILNALAWLEVIGLTPANKNQLAFLAGQRSTSGGYFNNLGALRSAGLITYPQARTVELTAAGHAVAAAPERPPTAEELHREIEAKVSSSQWAILRALIEVYPESLTKDELAERANQRATSGGYFNNLGTLRTLGLIDYPNPGRVVALPVLFLEGAAR